MWRDYLKKHSYLDDETRLDLAPLEDTWLPDAHIFPQSLASLECMDREHKSQAIA
jgi:hypothetical protein